MASFGIDNFVPNAKEETTNQSQNNGIQDNQNSGTQDNQNDDSTLNPSVAPTIFNVLDDPQYDDIKNTLYYHEFLKQFTVQAGLKQWTTKRGDKIEALLEEDGTEILTNVEFSDEFIELLKHKNTLLNVIETLQKETKPASLAYNFYTTLSFQVKNYVNADYIFNSQSNFLTPEEEQEYNEQRLKQEEQERLTQEKLMNEENGESNDN